MKCAPHVYGGSSGSAVPSILKCGVWGRLLTESYNSYANATLDHSYHAIGHCANLVTAKSDGQTRSRMGDYHATEYGASSQQCGGHLSSTTLRIPH
jgi:hypothetical protein